MTHVSLFAGIGGIDIAAEKAGFRTILFCEKDPYCQNILTKHWPGIPLVSNIRDLKGEMIDESVTLISGGPPCQPSSTAGKRRGREDDRWLWPEFARVVECILPFWVMAENPLGILSLENGLAIEEWITRLETQGYAFLPPLVYPIAALGADHRRYRVFFVAHFDGEHGDVGGHGTGAIFRQRPEAAKLQNGKTPPNAESGRREGIGVSARSRAEGQGEIDVARICEVDADADCSRRADIQGESIPAETPGRRYSCLSGWWDTRSRLLRMVHGIRGRMDGLRIKALGNSCSPQQVYPILRAIAEIEGGNA